MSVRKYGASTTTWSLPVRLLLTLVAASVPLWLVGSAARAVVTQDPGAAPIAIPLGAIGVLLLCLMPRFLGSVWAPNPRWQALQHAEAVQANAVADTLAKDDAGALRPARSTTPTWGRRRW